MGYDLTNDKGNDFRFNIHGWRPLLQIAEMHGWEPMGTTLDNDPEWDGSYYSNDGQYVTPEDSRALANALRSALDDIPDIRTAPDVITHVPEGFFNNPGWREHEVEMYLKHHAEPGQTQPVVMTLSEMQETGKVPTVLVVDTPGYYREAPLEYWSGENGKRYIREFIEFCANGGFEIG